MLRGVDGLMPIGEFSELSGLSPRRLRSYATGGLLVPAAVDSSSGYRYYSPGQLAEARLVNALRDAGMPLEDIACLLRDRAADRLDDWARQVEASAAQRHEALGLARRLLALDVHDTNRSEPPRKEAMMKLRAAARTHIGHVRKRNQDATLCLDRLVAVADGMGGHPAGEIAAGLVLTLLDAAFTRTSIDELTAAVRAANRAISDRVDVSPDLEGMGTTVCAVGVTGDGGLAVVHVGDSRAYLVQDHSLRQLTDDHSVTAELVRRGELTEEQARDHPSRSILTRVLGGGRTVEVDGAVHGVVEGDRLLLCTDGLFNEVNEREIASLVGSPQDVDSAADALVERALSNGGRDNVAVVVADVCWAPS